MLNVLSSHRSTIHAPEDVRERSAVLALYPTGNSGTSGGGPEESTSATNSNPQADEIVWIWYGSPTPPSPPSTEIHQDPERS